MERMVHATEYGICLWSKGVLDNFVKWRIVKKRLLAAFHWNRLLFIKLQKKGIWLPLPQIGCYNYYVAVKNFGEEFDDEWEKVLEYGGFNLSVKDGVWFSGFGSFLKYEKEYYGGEEKEETGSFGIVSHYDKQRHWYMTLNDYLVVTDVKVELPEGKYLVNISGFMRKELLEDTKAAANYGYQFEFVKVEQFHGYKNPRTDQFSFCIATTAKAKKKNVSA